MVLFIAPAVILLVTAKGKLIPDPAARQAAELAAAKVKPAHTCVVTAEKLQTEIDVFKASAKAAHIDSEEQGDAGAKKPAPTLPGRLRQKIVEKEKAPDINLAWSAAQPSAKAAKLL